MGRTAIFVFGDTFSFDQYSEFLGITSSTAATLIRDGTGTMSFQMDMDLLDNGVAACFIPMLNEELIWTDKRVALWCFGGIIFEKIQPKDGMPNVVVGWIFFQFGVDVSLQLFT